jgi:hypothetical protein
MGLNSEGPVECDLCKKTLKRRGNLLEHLRMVHQQLVRFSCQFCARGFYNRAQLRRHVQIMHMARKAGLEKTRVFLKKPSPVGFFWFFFGGVFLPRREDFWGFFQFQEYF